MGGTFSWGYENNWGVHVIPYIKFLEFLELLELFWILFGTGNVLEKIHFFRIVLELLLNSEFLDIQIFRLQYLQLPLLGSPICDKILFQFCPRQP